VTVVLDDAARWTSVDTAAAAGGGYDQDPAWTAALGQGGSLPRAVAVWTRRAPAQTWRAMGHEVLPGLFATRFRRLTFRVVGLDS
jgi:hypothetical protein